MKTILGVSVFNLCLCLVRMFYANYMCVFVCACVYTDPQIKRLLAHTVYYLAVQTSPTSTFSHFLQVKVSVETKVVHDALIQWGHRDPKDPNKPAIFFSSLEHLKCVYRYLYDNLTPKARL